MQNFASSKGAHCPAIGLRQDRRRKDKDMIETQKAPSVSRGDPRSKFHGATVACRCNKQFSPDPCVDPRHMQIQILWRLPLANAPRIDVNEAAAIVADAANLKPFGVIGNKADRNVRNEEIHRPSFHME